MLAVRADDEVCGGQCPAAQVSRLALWPASLMQSIGGSDDHLKL
jgi:hypothetical protein